MGERGSGEDCFATAANEKPGDAQIREPHLVLTALGCVTGVPYCRRVARYWPERRCRSGELDATRRASESDERDQRPWAVRQWSLERAARPSRTAGGPGVGSSMDRRAALPAN